MNDYAQPEAGEPVVTVVEHSHKRDGRLWDNCKACQQDYAASRQPPADDLPLARGDVYVHKPSGALYAVVNERPLTLAETVLNSRLLNPLTKRPTPQTFARDYDLVTRTRRH